MYVIKEIVKKVFYKLGLNLSIDWSARVQEMGADSVYDPRTLGKDKNQTTKDQIKLYGKLINNELCHLEITKVLDYGCGIGRHYEFLSSLNSLIDEPIIVGYDPTSELLKFSQRRGYYEVYDVYNYALKYDLIFCHMVLGGLSDQEVDIAIKDMKRSINPTGRIILIESVNNDNPRLYTKWKARSQESYMPKISGIEWSMLGETYENDDCLKIICGKLSS